jgi:predicted nucleic acid-binding protein
VADRKRTLASAIVPGRSVVVDSSVVLAYLSGAEPVSDGARQLFDAFAATGRNPVAISTVTVGEVLVRPFRRGPSAVATAEGFLRHFADLRVVDVTYGVAREAARLRAATDLPMPDAIIVASAAVTDADILVTNDRAWPARLRPIVPDLSVVVLADLA